MGIVRYWSFALSEGKGSLVMFLALPDRGRAQGSGGPLGADKKLKNKNVKRQHEELKLYKTMSIKWLPETRYN